MHVHTALKLTDVLRLQPEQFVGHQIPFVYVINVWYSERGRRSKGGIFLSPLGETLYRYQYSAELPQVRGSIHYCTRHGGCMFELQPRQIQCFFRIAFFFHVNTNFVCVYMYIHIICIQCT